MSTTSLQCRVWQQRLRGEWLNVPSPPGSFISGPRTLRPERLGWLTTPAANIGHRVIWGLWKIGHVAQIAASFSVCGWNTLAKCLNSRVIPAKAGISVVLRQNTDARFRGHDGQDWGMGWTGFALIHTSWALAPLFSTIVIRAEAWRGPIPSICLKAGPALR